MNIITNKKRIFLMITVFTVIYFCGYMTRKSLAVILPEICSQTSLDKSHFSIALTCLFIFYGGIQFISGVICDHINPKYILIASIAITGSCNLLIPFCYSNQILLIICWTINGIFQAFLWLPLIRISSYIFDSKNYATSSSFVTSGGYAGQCFLYFLAFICTKYFDFKVLFYIISVFAYLMTIIALISTRDIKIQTYKVTKAHVIESHDHKQYPLFTFLFVVLVLCIIILGAFRDSVEAWSTTFIHESFNVSTENAILSSIILPVLSVIFVEGALILFQKKFKNPIFLSAILSLIALLAVVVLLISGNRSSILGLIMLAISYGLTCALLHVLVAFVPISFKISGRISTVAGILNASAYIGSSIATYLIADISREDKFGWNGAIVAWLILIGSAFLILILLSKPWDKKYLKPLQEQVD